MTRSRKSLRPRWWSSIARWLSAWRTGPAAGLAIVDSLRDEKSLRHYQWLPSVRGDLLEKLGRREEARAEFLRAAELAGNERERELLLARAGKLA